MKKYSIYLGLLLVPLFFGACATFNPPPLDKAKMTPRDPALVFNSTGKSIEVGAIDGPRGKGQNIFLIDVYDLKKIVTDGLDHSKLFAFVETEPQPGVDYTLTAKIKEQTGSGLFTITANLIVDYEIKRAATGEVVYSKRITGTHSTTSGEAFQGMLRARLSVEGAARDNVRQFLLDISQLHL